MVYSELIIDNARTYAPPKISPMNKDPFLFTTIQESEQQLFKNWNHRAKRTYD